MMVVSSQDEDDEGVGGFHEDTARREKKRTIAPTSAADSTADAMTQQPLPLNWYAYRDSRGVLYYHNPILNRTQWEHPTAQVPSAVSAAAAPASQQLYEDSLHTPRGEANMLQLLGNAPTAGTLNISSTNRQGRGGKNVYSDPFGTPVAKGGFDSVDANGFLCLAGTDFGMQRKYQQADPSIENTTAYSTRLSSTSTIDPGSQRHSYNASAVGTAAEKVQCAAHEGSWLLSCCRFPVLYSVLQRLFAVTTADIIYRLRLTLIPWYSRRYGNDRFGSCRDSSDEGAEGRNILISHPDMYGPFWAATTLVVLAFACSNFPLLLSPAAAAAACVAADVRRLSEAAVAVYCCFLLPPVFVRLGLLYFGSGGDATAAASSRSDARGKHAPAMDQLLCLQGYALVPLCVCAMLLLLLQLLPTHALVRALQWISVAAAGAAASFFLFQQLRRLLQVQPVHVRGISALLLIGAVLLLLLLLLRFATVGQEQATMARNTELAKLLKHPATGVLESARDDVVRTKTTRISDSSDNDSSHRDKLSRGQGDESVVPIFSEKKNVEALTQQKIQKEQQLDEVLQQHPVPSGETEVTVTRATSSGMVSESADIKEPVTPAASAMVKIEIEGEGGKNVEGKEQSNTLAAGSAVT